MWQYTSAENDPQVNRFLFSVTETEYIPDKLHSAVNFFDNNHAVVRPCVKKFIRCESLFYGMLILILQSLSQMALVGSKQKPGPKIKDGLNTS